VKRLGVKATGYSGQRRIYFLFDRATRKFQGDLGLWTDYLNYARAQKAHKKAGKILTSLVRMHPTNWQLWSEGAKYSIEVQGDMAAARGYMQRGLRFCPTEKELWLEYATMEMLYIKKTMDSLRVLGVKREEPPQDSAIMANADDENDDVIVLPDLTDEDVNPSLAPENEEDRIALEVMASTPALSGSIPIAIFNAAMTQFSGDALLAEMIFNRITEFHDLACCKKVLNHVVQFLSSQVPATSASARCLFLLPLVGIEPSSAEFPLALRDTLQTIRTITQKEQTTPGRASAAKDALFILLPIAARRDLDSDIQNVLLTNVRQSVKLLGTGDAVAELVESLEASKRKPEALFLTSLGFKQYGPNGNLARIQSRMRVDEKRPEKGT
jgi:U3 small nucleolar RNA-associated protein 6